MLIYYYGAGKGKTTAALGTALRAAGHGWRCLIIQAIKSSWSTGESKLIRAGKIPGVSIMTAGLGFVGIQGDKRKRSEHLTAARYALEKTQEEIESRRWRLIVLDEFGDLPEIDSVLYDGLIAVLRKSKAHLVITGHRYRRRIAQGADVVTKMTKIKHPFDCGIMAEKGLDY